MIDEVESFFEGNALLTMLLAAFSVIFVCYIISRIFISFSYNKKVQSKFKRLNIIIRNVQLTDDREKFLKEFNKEITKKDKVVSPVWDSFLKNDEAVASKVFIDANLAAKKNHFINLFLVSSVLLSAALVFLGKYIGIDFWQNYDLDSRESTLLLILTPMFIICMGLLLNLSYSAVKSRMKNRFAMHYDFFIENIDGVIKGFVKNDFFCSNGQKPKADKTDSVNVISYEDYQKTQMDNELTESDRESLQELAQANIAKQKAQELSGKADQMEESLVGEVEENDNKNEDKDKDEKQSLREELFEELKNFSNEKSDASALIQKAKEIEKVKTEAPSEDVDESLRELVSAKKRTLASNTQITKAKAQPTPAKKQTQQIKVAKKKTVSDALGQLIKVSKNSNLKRSEK